MKQALRWMGVDNDHLPLAVLALEPGRAPTLQVGPECPQETDDVPVLEVGQS
jgi:hypothetical protein